MHSQQQLITIRSPVLQADIHPLGAQLFALRDAEGRDLQWNGDPAVWKGRAPILFPIVGALADNRYRVDGRVYALPRHGFARDKFFSLIDVTPSSARFRLSWDGETLKIYPFRFQLDMHFALLQGTLSVVVTIRNLEAETDLPASFGFHPALRWPLPYGQSREAHFLLFEREETAPIRRLNTAGLLRPEAFPTPVTGRQLALRDDLFLDDAIVFDSLASQRVRYGAESGPYIDIAFPDTAALGLWSKPQAGFICIEPWHGYADPEGFSGDFRRKPGIFRVPPDRQ